MGFVSTLYFQATLFYLRCGCHRGMKVVRASALPQAVQSENLNARGKKGQNMLHARWQTETLLCMQNVMYASLHSEIC